MSNWELIELIDRKVTELHIYLIEAQVKSIGNNVFIKISDLYNDITPYIEEGLKRCI